MKKIKKAVASFITLGILLILSGCYQFETNPLTNSSVTFESSQLFKKLKLSKESLELMSGAASGAADSGQPSPFGDLQLDTPVLEISENVIAFAYNEGGAWSINTIMVSSTHLSICFPMEEENNPVNIPDGVKVVSEGSMEEMNYLARVYGQSLGLKKFVENLTTSSFKYCVAVPLTNLS